MALQLFDLNRANDTPIATLMLSEIAPGTRRPLLPDAGSTRVFIPQFTTEGGAVGDDVDQATATAMVDISTPNAPLTSFPQPGSPRNLAERAANTGNTLSVDVARARGRVAPYQPYPVASDPPLPPPVITTLTPATAAINTDTVVVTITGTGFSNWSTVSSGGFPIPSQFVDSTHLRIIQKPWASVPGTVQIVVTDHNVRSAPADFVFTAPAEEPEE